MPSRFGRCEVGEIGIIKMKQAADHYTADMFSKRPVGRPRKADAQSVKQRVREYRARIRTSISVTCNENSADQICTLCRLAKENTACSGLCKVGQLGRI